MSIDVHAHLAVPAANALAASAEGFRGELAAEQTAHSEKTLEVNQKQLKDLGPRLTDPQLRLSDMDAMGIEITVVGPMPMHHYWADRDLATQLTRIKNDAIVEHCSVDPHRLRPMGTIPLQHPDLAVAELEHLAKTHDVRSVSVSTNIDGLELSNEKFDPVWAKAAELGIVVFIHPWGCSLGARLAQHYLGNTVGQPTELTVALSHLIFDGTFDRHPKLKVLSGHGGGYLPTYIGRSDHAWSARPDAHKCERTPSAYFDRITFDNLVFTGRGIRFLAEAVGTSQVVIGTDYPFDMGVTDPMARLESAGFDAATHQAIAHDNALRLFGWSK